MTHAKRRRGVKRSQRFKKHPLKNDCLTQEYINLAHRLKAVVDQTPS